MLDENEIPDDDVPIPRSELRQLASLLSGSATILERLLSAQSSSRSSRRETEDLEAQLLNAAGDQEKRRTGFGPAQVDVTFPSWRYNAIQDHDQRTADKWKAIEQDPQASETFELLLKLWTSLDPRRDHDDIMFREMYLVILPSEPTEKNPVKASDLGPQLALVKDRRQRLRTPKHQVGSLGYGYFSIGIAINSLFDVSRTNIGQQLSEVTLGQALDVCHQKNVMPPTYSPKKVFEQVKTLLDTMELVNLTTRRDILIPIESYSEAELLNLSIQQAMELFSQEFPSIRESNMRSTEGSIPFQKLDLNVDTLREIGRLRIQWTPYLEHHLRLDVPNLVLYVFWFGTTYFKNASGWWNTGRAIPRGWSKMYPDHSPERMSLMTQVALGRSYEFLFNNPAKGSRADTAAAYRSMPVPWWVEDYYEAMGCQLSKGGDATMADVLAADLPLPDDIRENGPSKHIGWTWYLETQAFEEMGPFENRVRILDAYMKSKKPTTLRGLWRDKRDSLQWYTLWVVIIFGGISIILGFLGLALTTAQTVAAFEQVEGS